MADRPIDPLGLMQALATAWAKSTAAPPQPAVDAPTARMMAQALAAANMPSREEVGEIAERLDRIEDALARIERQIKPAKRVRARKPAKPKS